MLSPCPTLSVLTVITFRTYILLTLFKLSLYLNLQPSTLLSVHTIQVFVDNKSQLPKLKAVIVWAAEDDLKLGELVNNKAGIKV